jgi:hypothetical protein
MQSIISLAPPSLILKQSSFLERMNKFFSKTGKITLNELEILLNDEFIFEMTLLISFETKDIIKKTIAAFSELKQA